MQILIVFLISQEPKWRFWCLFISVAASLTAAAAATFSSCVSPTTPDVLKNPSIVNYVKLPYWKNKDFIMVISAFSLNVLIPFTFLTIYFITFSRENLKIRNLH